MFGGGNMKLIPTALLVSTVVAAIAGDDAVMRERQKGKLFPVLDPDLLHQFEAGTFGV
jgi:hypothetical protein